MPNAHAVRGSGWLCGLSILIALLGNGCSPKPSSSSSQTRPGLPFTLAPTANPNMDALKLARLCSDDADKFWSRHNWKNGHAGAVSYSNHFNKQLGRCLVDVRTVSPPNPAGEFVESDQIYDAQDDTALASQSLTEKSTDLNADILRASYTKEGRAVEANTEIESFIPWFKGLMTQ